MYLSVCVVAVSVRHPIAVCIPEEYVTLLLTGLKAVFFSGALSVLLPAWGMTMYTAISNSIFQVFKMA